VPGGPSDPTADAPVSVLAAFASGPASLQAVMPAARSVVADEETSAQPAIEENAWGWHGQYTREALAYLWLVGLVAVAYLVGFVWAIGAFCLLYGLTCTKRYIPSVVWRVTFSVLSAVVMAVVAYEALKFAHVAYIPRIQL
jgi:hypothetical protein